jgi:hypothetical protein
MQRVIGGKPIDLVVLGRSSVLSKHKKFLAPLALND